MSTMASQRVLMAALVTAATFQFALAQQQPAGPTESGPAPAVNQDTPPGDGRVTDPTVLQPGGALIAPRVYEEIANAGGEKITVIAVLTPVQLQPREQQAVQQSDVAAIQDRVLGRIDERDFSAVRLYRNFPVMAGRVDAAGLARLAADPDVVSIGPNLRGGEAADVSVPFINADVVQDMGYTGEGITVAVLDTGIKADHPDLSDDIADGAYTFINDGHEEEGAVDRRGHGTNVAGIITSKGTVAPIGVAPDTDVLAVKVINDAGIWHMDDLIDGIDYVVSKVWDYDMLCAINMSLGTWAPYYSACPCDDEADLQGLKVALQAARNVGIIPFAASGNGHSCSSMCAPACLSSVVAVAAVHDQDLGSQTANGCTDTTTYPDKITCYSNRSGCNQLAAPGHAITSCGIDADQLSTYYGTSQATPHCTALAALIAEAGAHQGIGYMPSFIIDLMESTGAPTDDPCATTPNPIRIDAAAALAGLGIAQPCQVDRMVAAGGAGLFGGAIDISGDVIVVGEENAGGAAYVYRRQGVDWVQEAKLTANDPLSYYFGYSVAIDGDVVVVGDPWAQFAGEINVGAAYVFQYFGGSWIPVTKLIPADFAANDWFGVSVAIDGDHIVVGAYQNDDACPASPNCDSGSAYVFKYDGEDWWEDQKLIAHDDAAGDRFGCSVAIDGVWIAVGAYQDDGVGGDSGSAYTFKYLPSPFDWWTQQAKLTADDAAGGDQFGVSVSIENTDDVYVAIGAWKDDHVGGDAGSAYVFQRNGGTWPQMWKLTAWDAKADDRFGVSVSISDGRVLVGARQDDHHSRVDAGSAYLFDTTGWQLWQKYKLTAAGPGDFAWFGEAVALEGARAAIGARQENSNAGAAYIFAVADDCNDNDVTDLCDILWSTSADANDNAIPDDCEWCLGDLNCSSGSPDFLDISYFVAALNGEANWTQYYRDHNGGADPPCPWLLGDYSVPPNGVDFLDIVPFANSIGQPCLVYTP